MAGITDPLLIDISNAFYTGNYQQCINLSEKIKKPSLEKDIFMYRSYLATNRYRVVLDEVPSSGELLPIRFFADYLLNKNKFADLIEILEKKIQSDDDCHIIYRVIAAIMYIHENQYEEALRILNGTTDLECQAIQVYIFLRISRLDLAKKILASMTEKNDDDTLTQLAQAWFNLELGGEKLQDAHYIFDDFKDKFAPSVLLLNNLAVCALGQQKFDEDTNGYLRDGLDKESNNYDLLVNFIFYSQQTDKNAEQVINRYLSMLRETCKNSELVEELAKKETEFDRLCQNYSFQEAEKITS
ncbi:CLUMA_CG019572, isoform A [Clunio marinus]|uniref:Coatomer subunit epsilon n=1 Tax=Clunio marinus TaxID=568069 RepID=A0A1J1J2C1_9DIPT|nr:CLUMA_CG019572, isoform A [Clunio marinus]